MEFNQLEIADYTVHIAVNGIVKFTCPAESISNANSIYDTLLNMYVGKSGDHIKIYIYDFNKAVNIKEYDSHDDDC